MTRQNKSEGEFIRWFAEHVATFTEHVPEGDKAWPLSTLIWAKPDSGQFAIRYVIMGPVLMVWGDLECAVYRWSSHVTWDFLAGCDLQYFEGKCEASPKGRDYEDYDPDMALTDFNDAIKQRVEEGYDAPNASAVEEGRQAIRYGTDEWHEWMRSDGHRVFGSDWYEYLPGLGKEIALTCAAHLAGIKMAVAQRKQAATTEGVLV